MLFRQHHLLVMYYLIKFDDVIWSSFWVISKITSANLCKSVHDIINFSLSFAPLNLESVEKKGKSYKISLKFFKNEKSFLDKIKSIFHSFWKAIMWWKKKEKKSTQALSTEQIIENLTILFTVSNVSGDRLQEVLFPLEEDT